MGGGGGPGGGGVHEGFGWGLETGEEGLQARDPEQVPVGQMRLRLPRTVVF